MDPLIDQAKKDFALTGITDITHLINPIIQDKICQESNTAFRLYGKPNAFILVNGNELPTYENPELLRTLSNIAGNTVIAIPSEKEEIVINVLADGGDTHGWHFDDSSQ